MKERKILSAIGLADEKYIEEANPARMKWARAAKRMGALAAGACVLLTLWLGYRIIQQNPSPTPPQKPSFEKYSNDPYYSVIEKLGLYQYQLELDAFYNKDTDTDKDDDGPDNTSPSNQPHYVNTPPVQAEGVSAGSLIQQNQKYVYYLAVQENAAGAVLYAYPYEEWHTDPYYELNEWEIVGVSSETHSYRTLGSYRIRGDLSIEYRNYVNEDEWNMHLSEDGCTLTVFSEIYHRAEECRCTRVLSFDVSDPKNITLKKEIIVKGALVCSVKVDGRLLLVTESFASQNYDDKYTLLPWLWNGNKKVMPEPENIVTPKQLAGTEYTSVWMLEEATLELKDSYAFLSNYQSRYIYISEDSIVLSRSYTVQAKSFAKGKEMTELVFLSHGAKSMKKRGTVSVEGQVTSARSMVQYDDLLLLATSFETEKEQSTANFYCISLSDRKIRSKKLRFAPNGSTVRSVHLQWERAYVTLSEQSLPNALVYVFDFSDPDTLRYQNMGSLGKYFDTLYELEDDYLLSIWEDENGYARVNIYRQEGQNVVSVCEKTFEGSLASYHHRDILFNKELGVFGFECWEYKNDKYHKSYLLFRFEDGVLEQWLNIPVEAPDKHTPIFVRHFAFVGDRVCVFDEDGYTVYPFRLEKVK